MPTILLPYIFSSEQKMGRRHGNNNYGVGFHGCSFGRARLRKKITLFQNVRFEVVL